jgi:hypothetical protein
MAKKKEIELDIKSVNVIFVKDFKGNFNGFAIDQKAKDKVELPLHIYEWIQKFNVCKA